MRSILAAQPGENGMDVVTDMEAGVEHLSRATTRASDIMLIVAEPYFKSLETAARVAAMAAELGIPRHYIVANKVRTAMEEQAMRAFFARHGLDLLEIVPYDEKLAEASMVPQAPLDLYPESEGVRAIVRLADQVEAMRR